MSSTIPLDKLSEVGTIVEIDTMSGSKIKGQVFCRDAASDVVVVHEDAGSTVRIVAVSAITRVLPHAPVFADDAAAAAAAPLVPLNGDKLREREERAVARIRREAAKLGVGVTAQAQSIFNALLKTLPCRWVDQTIVIFEDRFEVRLAAPYTVDNVSGNDAPSVARVKKVLSGELAKLT